MLPMALRGEGVRGTWSLASLNQIRRKWEKHERRGRCGAQSSSAAGAPWAEGQGQV